MAGILHNGGTVQSGGYNFNISVVDPVKQDQNGLNPYITYKVNTSTDRPDFPYPQFSAIRRFKDFVWLHERLGEEFPGVINPPLPDKETLKRFDVDSIEKRRAELERYLSKVAAHEELSGSSCFMTFLQADDAAMAEKKDEKSKGNPAGVPANFMKWFDEAVTLVKTAIVPDDVTKKTDTDMRFDAVTLYINNLDAQIQAVAKHSSSLVKKQADLGTTMFDFGFSFTQLSAAEKEYPSLCQVLQTTADKADFASQQMKGKVPKEADQFEKPILEYAKTIKAVKAALAKRQEKKMIYQLAASDVESKALAFQKLEGLPGKEDKLPQAEEALRNAQVALETSKVTYEKVSSRLLREIENFKKEKAIEIRRMLLDYVNIQIEYHSKMEECWTSLQPSIESMEIED